LSEAISKIGNQSWVCRQIKEKDAINEAYETEGKDEGAKKLRENIQGSGVYER